MARTHGKASTYTGGKCRCEDCTRAHTEWQRGRLRSRMNMSDLYQLPSPTWNNREWYDDAACNGHAHPEWWFPTDALPFVVERAVQICRSCPVRAECAATAKATGEKFGIWGGDISRLTPAEQRRYRDWKQNA